MLTHVRSRLRMVRGDDSGFSLVEVVVAMVVFAIMAVSALGVTMSVFDVTSDNQRRVAASNLATKQIETSRSQRAVAIPDGATTRTERVAGTTYTIVQNANYVSSGSDTSLCASSSGQLAYKLVSVTVTWPDMGSTKPVTADTVLALGVGDEGLDASRGVLAIRVSGTTGDPEAGVVVTLTPGGQSRTTGSDGCAVFVDLPVGAFGTDYTARVNQAGYVSAVNAAVHQVVVGAIAGNVRRGELRYDQGRTLTVAAGAPSPAHQVPAGMPVGIRSADVDGGAILPVCPTSPVGSGCTTAFPGTSVNLFPAIYDVWAGPCAHPRPAGTSSNVDLFRGDATVTVPMEGVGVRVVARNGDAGSLTGYRVSAVSDCGGPTLTLPPTGLAGSTAALPAGTWTVTVRPPSGSGSRTATFTVNPGDGSVDVPVRRP